MNSRILSVVSMFVASVVVGYNLLPSTQTVQAAQPPVFISPIEFASLMKMNQPVEEINVEVDLETQEVTITGATGNKKVNVTTTGKAKADTVVKWRTKVKEKVVHTGHPYVKAINDIKDEEQPKSITELLYE